jgi:coenzyme F420-reducing hydrogenase gamma subunit
LPTFYDKVRPVSDFEPSGLMVGGCPPHHDFVTQAVMMVAEGKLPPACSWMTSGKAFCDTCDPTRPMRTFGGRDGPIPGINDYGAQAVSVIVGIPPKSPFPV